MSRRDGYQHGVPSWIAGAHPDPEQAVAFYGELLGWQGADTGSPDPYFVCKLHGRDVAAIGAPLGADAGAAWRTNIWVESADETAARVAAEGGSVVTEPFDLPGVGRSAVLADPAGAVFGVFEPGEHQRRPGRQRAGRLGDERSPTPDPEGAKAFYGAVFGWQADAFAMGDVDVMMWRLPGFVGGEPMQPVPRDVVATGFRRRRPRLERRLLGRRHRRNRQDGGGARGRSARRSLGPADREAAALADPQGATFSVTRIATP